MATATASVDGPAVADATSAKPKGPVKMDFADQAKEQFLGPNGTMHYFTNSRGKKLCSYLWPASGTPKAILVLTHGHGSYLCYDYLASRGPGNWTTYEGSWVQRLCASGYALCGIDYEGCGRSEGLRCYCERFSYYVEDVVNFTGLCTKLGVATFEPHLPKFIMGESMGGCVALTAVLHHDGVYAGVVGLAPMVSLEKVAKQGLNPYLRPVGTFLSWAIPKLGVVSTNRNTLYPDLQDCYDTDPNCYHEKTRARNGFEYLRATERLMREAAGIRAPLLLFHGMEDTQTDPEGSRQLYEAAQSEDKTLVTPPKMWHILVKEPGNEALLQQLIEWLDERAVGPKSKKALAAAEPAQEAAQDGAAPAPAQDGGAASAEAVEAAS